MAYQLINGRFQAFTDTGSFAVGYQLYTYDSGTTTPKATYTDATLTSVNANPVVLDARGEAQVWLGSGAYTFVLKDASGVTVWTVDGVIDPAYAVQLSFESEDDAKGDALMSVKARYPGAIARTQHDKNAETVSVLDFGAKGDGVADDTVAIQAALDSGAAQVFIPPTSAFYRVTNTLNMNAAVYGLGGPFRASSTIKMDSATAKPVFKGVGAELRLNCARGISVIGVQNLLHTAFYGSGYQVDFEDLFVQNFDKGFDIDGVYVRWDRCWITNCNKGVYPAWLRAVIHLPSTVFSFVNTVFTYCTYGFLNENRFGQGQNEDLIGLNFTNCGFEKNTNGFVATQRTWLTRVESCWFEANATKSFSAAVSDVIWICNRVDPNDPLPIFPPANDAYLGSVQINPRDSWMLTAYVRTLTPNVVEGEANALTMNGSLAFAPQYLPNGNTTEAGKELTQIFSDNTGTAKAGVRFARFNSLSGGGVRSSAEVRIAAQGSSSSGDGMPYQDVLVVRGNSVLPAVDNGQTLGAPGSRWSVVYAATGTINTSDERAKDEIEAIPDVWLDAWADVQWMRFKFSDSIRLKGTSARWHVGLIAQRVRDAFIAHGLDAFQIGLLCWDEWSEQPEVLDADGTITAHAAPAGDRFGIRYEEALAMEAALMRRELSRIRGD